MLILYSYLSALQHVVSMRARHADFAHSFTFRLQRYKYFSETRKKYYNKKQKDAQIGHILCTTARK